MVRNVLVVLVLLAFGVLSFAPDGLAILDGDEVRLLEAFAMSSHHVLAPIHFIRMKSYNISR